MSIASEVTDLQTNLQAAKTAVTTKGGTVGNTGLAGLASEIATIPSGGGEQYLAPYGNVELYEYSFTWSCYANCYPGTITAEVLDQERFDDFVNRYSYDPNFVNFSYSSYDGQWFFTGSGEPMYFADEGVLYDTTGLKILWDDYGQSREYADVTVQKSTSINTNVVKEMLYLNTLSDFNGMANQYGDGNMANGIPAAAVKSIVVGASATSLPNGFIRGCTYIQTIDFSKAVNVTTIGKNVLNNLGNFNSPLVFPPNVTSIGDECLQYCASFNSPITFPSGLKSIGSKFLGASSYSPYGSFNQPITFPDSLESIGDYFLNLQRNFNSKITFGNSIKKIGTYFLSMNYSGWASLYDKPLTLPSTITSIGTRFLSNAKNFVGPLTVETTAIPGTSGTTTQYVLSTQWNTVPMYTTGVTIKGSQRAAWLSALPNRTSNPYRKLIDGGA